MENRDCKKDIKIFVACHKLFPIPKNEMLHPVQVGTAIAKERFSGFLHDDEGENISNKNRRYCELTAQYWAWKNIQADYYGLFHYRRYLYPASKKNVYILRSEPTGNELAKLGYDGFANLIIRYDLIAPVGENMHISVRQHYLRAPYHHEKDLALAVQILKELFPNYSAAAEEYLEGCICYFGNICVMSKDVFDDYNKWLFAILEEFDRRADMTGYCIQELRVDGYLAERLFGIYYTFWKKKLRCLELPRVHFEENVIIRLKNTAINSLLPPGTYRRYLAKSACGGIRREKKVT